MHAELILASYIQQTVALHFLAMIGLVNLISSCCQAGDDGLYNYLIIEDIDFW